MTASAAISSMHMMTRRAMRFTRSAAGSVFPDEPDQAEKS
jgi:hypothetical protein